LSCRIFIVSQKAPACKGFFGYKQNFREEVLAEKFLRQHRTNLMVQMRRRIFRHVTDHGKYASRCAIKTFAAICAVLP